MTNDQAMRDAWHRVYSVDWNDPSQRDDVEIWRESWQQATKEIERLQAIEAAARALVKAKGRYHTEQNFKALSALFDLGKQ